MRITLLARLRLSLISLLIGALFFVASLAPSMLPRTYALQGLISGLSLSAGYALGVFLSWLWHYLELPTPSPLFLRYSQRLSLLGALGIGALALHRSILWQQTVHELMQLPSPPQVYPFAEGAIALGLFAGLVLLARGLRLMLNFYKHYLQHLVPQRVALLMSLALTLTFFWLVVDGVLLRGVLRTVDKSYQQLDALIPDDMQPPTEIWQTGSPTSVLHWQDLGQQGRNYISQAPRAAEISALTLRPAKQALRVYVGLNSADTPQARAQLALAELQRIGAFQRQVLVIATPTGTGWVDSAAMDTVEFLQHGDIASVALQYSYLSSPLALWVEPEYGKESARALFNAVYGYWTTLAKTQRPKLYLFGLSLGALNSDSSFDLFDVLNDPPQGALWSGPPFNTRTWQVASQERDKTSAAWLPQFRQGTVVRFMNQAGMPATPVAWGPFRVLFLQYGSDPITFFRPDMFYRQPPWLETPRAPDVSTQLRWFPLVTGLQVAADMLSGTGTVPVGFGHDYAAEHYIEAWLALLEPPDWSATQVQALKTYFRTKRYAQAD